MPACKTVGLAELNQVQIYIFKNALCFYMNNIILTVRAILSSKKEPESKCKQPHSFKIKEKDYANFCIIPYVCNWNLLDWFFYGNYSVQVSAHAEEFITTSEKEKKKKAELTATTYRPQQHAVLPLPLILGFFCDSSNSLQHKIAVGCQHFSCVFECCVCHISMISPGWLKYCQTVFNWGKLNGSHFNGAQTEAPQWKVILWLRTCKVHCWCCCSLCACQKKGKLYCIVPLRKSVGDLKGTASI